MLRYLIPPPERCRLRFGLDRSRLADKQMNVLRHQNVSGNHQAVSLTHLLNLAL
jgi:hypothetical protein